MARGRKKASEPKVVNAEAMETFGQVVDGVLRTDAGKRFFIHMWNRCGFAKSSLVHKRDGDINEDSTKALEAQRLIYLEMRNAASLELLLPVEETAEQQARVKPLAAKPQEEVRK